MSASKKNVKIVAFSLEPDLIKLLDKKANETKRSRSNYLSTFISKHLKQENKV